MMSQLPIITRDFYATIRARLEKFNPLIQIVSGPRQVGKTTALRIFQETYPEKTRYLSLDNPGPEPQERIRFEWEQTCRIAGHKILILDEIQNVPNWGSLIKELFDRERPKRELSVAILGSSALELLLRGEESLLGRFEIVRAPHWSYFETKRAFGWDLNRYLKFGGYPILAELLEEENTESLKRCQNFVRDAILEPVITRDIFSLRPVVNTALFRQVLQLALTLPCEEISFTKISGQLSEKGSSASVKAYLELLEKAFLIRLLGRFSEGQIRQRASSPKIIPLAPALIHAYAAPQKIENDPAWFGHVYEAAIISRFHELGFNLFYWSNSREDVDLVIQDDSLLCAIEIKAGQNSSWKGLKAFKNKYPHAKTLLLDRERGERFLLAANPREELEMLLGGVN